MRLPDTIPPCIILTLIAVLLIPGILLAESSSNYGGQGYGFFSAGMIRPGATGIMHFGGGGEGFICQGLGLGAEIGCLAPCHQLLELSHRRVIPLIGMWAVKSIEKKTKSL